MGAVKFNQFERDALRGLPLISRCIYFELRYRMDFSTGLVGAKRGAGISWQCLREWLFVEPHPGMKDTGSPHKSTVRRAVLWLERARLICNQSVGKRLVFECLLADRDLSDQKKGDTKPTQQTSKNTSTIIPFERGNSRNRPQYGDTHNTSQADIPPGSGINKQTDRPVGHAQSVQDDDNQTPGLGEAIQILIDGGVRHSIATSTDHRIRLKDLLQAGATRSDIAEALCKARNAKRGQPFTVFYLTPIIEQQIHARRHPKGEPHGARKQKLSAEELAIQQLGGGRVYEHEG